MILWLFKKIENFYDQTIMEKSKMISFKLYRSKILITRKSNLIKVIY